MRELSDRVITMPADLFLRTIVLVFKLCGSGCRAIHRNLGFILGKKIRQMTFLPDEVKLVHAK